MGGDFMKAYFLERQFMNPSLEYIYEKTMKHAAVEIVFKDWVNSQQVIEGAQDADAVFSMAIPMNAEVINAIPGLKFIGRCGIGYDSVDLNAATAKGVVVCNVPDYCVHEVAAQALTLLMSVARQLPAFVRRAREGGFGPGQGNTVYRMEGQTLGLLGLGRTGRMFAKMALGLGLKVTVFDPYVKDTGDPDITLVPFDKLIRQSDIISLHMPLTPETKYILAAPQFKQMKNTVIIVNTSRGALINTNDLVSALRNGEVRGAGLDVHEIEPLPSDHALFSLRNAVITPHVALYSEEALADMHSKLTEQAIDVLSGHKTRNIVNPIVLDKLSLS
jgi:D-3-phosphoglycerate dehydrogenase